MNTDGRDREGYAASWRFKLGTAAFISSVLVPVVGVPVVSGLGLSSAATASVSGLLLVGAEILGIVAVSIMGKPGFVHIKKLAAAFISRHGPPAEVSRGRYTCGLVMFFLPILFGWLSIYVANYIPGFLERPLPYAVGGDLLLLASFFVLGGNFWDKIRALFLHDAVAVVSDRCTTRAS